MALDGVAHRETECETVLYNKQLDKLLHDVSYGRTQSAKLTAIWRFGCRRQEIEKGKRRLAKDWVCLRSSPFLGEETILFFFVKSQKCPYHVMFDLDLDEHTLDAGPPGAIVCKFGGNPAICLGEENICANVYRRTDRWMDWRCKLHDCI